MHIASSTDADRRGFGPTELALADLLQNCDPIGVYEGDITPPPPGEYDDLVRPILAELRKGASVESLTRDLRAVLASDYGLSNVVDVEATARSILTWWTPIRDD